MKALALLLGIVTIGCGASSVKGLGGCSLGELNAQVRSLTCVQATQARALGLAVSPNGQHAVVGTYEGNLSFAGAPVLHSGSPEKFLWTTGRDLSSPRLTSVNAPGWVRSVSVGPRGTTVFTDSPKPPEGPFLTVYDSSGVVALGADLTFGGITTSAVPFGEGFLLRQQASGVRVVQVTNDGRIVGASALLSPPHAYEFPLSVAENGVVNELAIGSDGTAFVITTRATTGESGEPTELVSRIAPNGATIWQRGFWLGHHSQLARMGDGVVALSADTEGFCAQLQPRRGFALTRIDAAGQVRWQRCFPGDVTGLRLATNGTDMAITGQFQGTFRLDDSQCPVNSESLGSFVAWFHDQKIASSGCFGTGGQLVAIQSLAMSSEGRVSIAGATGLVMSTGYVSQAQQRYLFLAILDP